MLFGTVCTAGANRRHCFDVFKGQLSKLFHCDILEWKNQSTPMEEQFPGPLYIPKS